MQTRCLYKPAYFPWKLSSFFYIASAILWDIMEFYGNQWKNFLFVRMICKPDPVNTLCLVTIHLDPLLPISSSDQPGLCLEKPSYAHESLLGLAPGGACRAFFVTKKAVSSYLTFSPLPNNQAVYFLWRFPSGYPGQLLAGTIFHGVRTFLSF